MTNNDFISNARKMSHRTELQVNSPHHPVFILLDISGSVIAWKPEIERAVREFIEKIMGKTEARKSVDLGIGGYNDEFHLIQDWCSVSDAKEVVIEPGGMTNMTEGLEKAVEMIREKHKLNSDLNVGTRVPYLIHVTDAKANCGDLTNISKTIRDLVASGRLKVFTLCVDDYARDICAMVSGNGHVFEIESGKGVEAFLEFFHFASELVIRTSTAVPGAPIEVSDLTIGNKDSAVNIAKLDVNPVLDAVVNG